jgi:hypothetical protein
MKIYLISKLAIDKLENIASAAVGYRGIGYVGTREEAEILVKNAGNTIGDGWPIDKGESLPNLSAKEYELMTVEQIEDILLEEKLKSMSQSELIELAKKQLKNS